MMILSNHHLRYSWHILLLLCMSMLMLNACSSNKQLESRGYYLGGIDLKLAQLKIGSTTETEAKKILGSPTLAYASVDKPGNSWIYVNYQVRKYLFKHQRIVERKMLKLQFNSQGILIDFTGVQTLPLSQSQSLDADNE